MGIRPRKKLLLLAALLMVFFAVGKNNIFQGLRPLVRAVESKAILYKTRNFNEIETDNFIFRYEDIDKETLKLIRETAKQKYKNVVDIFDYKLEEKILVVVYNDMDLMMDNTMIKRGNPPVGVYYGNSIHISNPKLWIKDTENLKHKFYREGPMLHELVHLFVDHIGRGNFPIWFTEGVSLYFEYMVDDYEWGKDENINNYTIGELNSNFHSLNQYEAYTASFRLVKNMVNTYGLNRLINIINLLGDGYKVDDFLYLFDESGI